MPPSIMTDQPLPFFLPLINCIVIFCLYQVKKYSLFLSAGQADG